jgi:hypothetical protein
MQSMSDLSLRQKADLEERICTAVGRRVSDPVLHRNLDSLQWIHKRIAVSQDGSLQVLLRLPSLLHPSLDELKLVVKEQAELEFRSWLSEKGLGGDWISNVNVEAIATKPIPMMARLVEDPDELVSSLGPGLTNVTHFLAVYSCKVRHSGALSNRIFRRT